MRVRLALAAVVAAAAIAPLSGTASAFAGNEELAPTVCATWYKVCAATDTCRLFG